MNTSSTWRPNGFWQLGNERNLGIYANGLFGNDTMGLGIQGSGGPTLEDQIMAVIRTEEIYVGMFAVNPKRTNYIGITEQGQASYMTTLKNQSLISSVSFGYTAGKVLGSLTLGGYDQARFTPNNMTFSFAPDTDRDIVVGIQSITSTDQDGTKRDLLPTGINAYVDSTVPQIWLPLEACKLFENAFGLTLDLQAKPPFAPNATRYFLLQRAANETQYTLGRTFLQEAYLTVDWERQNFSISQCCFHPDTSQQNLVSIPPVKGSTSTADQQEATSNGMIIGVAVGVAVAIVLIFGGAATFFIVRKRKQKQQGVGRMARGTDDEAEKIRQGFVKAELDTDPNHAVYEMGHSGIDLHAGTPQDFINDEAKYSTSHIELMGDRMMAEMNGSGQLASELPSYPGFSGPFHEIITSTDSQPEFQLLIRRHQISEHVSGRPVECVFTDAPAASRAKKVSAPASSTSSIEGRVYTGRVFYTNIISSSI
ncbi:MAG: hypothetical protein Q9221_007666 [Calogaya cf. arnoldii]